jgi:gliding motility-associated-like protein
VILGEAVTLNPQATLNYDCVNNSASNSVTVTVDASNLPADLDYALDGSTVFQASNVFTDVTPGQHTIDVRHSNGCIKQVVFDVVQVDPLTLTLADGGLNEIVATATGGGGNYQYTLDGESYGNQSNFIIYKSGNYTVTVTDINGCTATATRYFEFIDIKIPNVFTPNGDGNNDTWAPTNTINYKDLVFYVYDRYGRKLGSYRESQFWDGKYNGNELPSGDYWYVIKIRDAKDAREFVGHFTLYR